MNTGPLPVIPPTPARTALRGSRARSGPLETTVEELFGAVSGRHFGGTAAVVADHGSAALRRPVPVAAGHEHPDAHDDDERDGRHGDRLVAGEGPSASSAISAAAAGYARLRVIADTSGPRVPLGLLWFGVGALAIGLHPIAAFVVFALVAAVAAIQTGAALRRAGARSNPILAGVAVLLVGLAGLAPSSRVVGLAILISLVGSLIVALHLGGFDIDAAGATVRGWVGPALVAGSVVVLARIEPAMALLCFVLVCTYDAGDYLVGSASANAVEGPLAGIVGVLAVGCAAAVLHPGALADHSVWPLVLATAIGCPAGQLAGSAMLPHAGSFAPALRRIDSLLVTGPLWMLLIR